MVRFVDAASVVLFAVTSTFSANDVEASDSSDATTIASPCSKTFSISYWHEFNAAEPRVRSNIQEDIISRTHFNVWGYSTNFIDIDFLRSPITIPRAMATLGAQGRDTCGYRLAQVHPEPRRHLSAGCDNSHDPQMRLRSWTRDHNDRGF
jgi:hypothetical protein